MIRRELEYFLGAVRFFTRLSVPAWVGHSAEALNGSARWFPAVGLVVGGIAADPSVATAPTEGRIRGMLRRALSLLGTPYRWGGTTPENGFDCSGLVGYVFRNNLGIELPRISRDMAKVGETMLKEWLDKAGPEGKALIDAYRK